MMNEVEKKTVMEVSAKLLSTADSLAKGGFIGRMDMSLLLAELGGNLGQLILKKVSLHSPTPSSNSTDAERLKRYYTVRYTGIEFKRYFSPKFVRLVGSFVNPAGDKSQNHVYELLVKESANHPGRWIAKGTNDGRELFTLTCASKWNAERLGFGALRSYLLRNLRRTIKANKAKEGK